MSLLITPSLLVGEGRDGGMDKIKILPILILPHKGRGEFKILFLEERDQWFLK